MQPRLLAAAFVSWVACEPAARVSPPPPPLPSSPGVAARTAPSLPPAHPLDELSRAFAASLASDPLMPPTDEPKAYAAWYAQLSAANRAVLDRRCTDAGDWYRYTCGGITKLHIPFPPHSNRMMARGPTPHHQWIDLEATWLRSLDRAQRAYYHQECDQYLHMEYWNGNDLCGEGGTPLVVAFHDEPVAYTAGTTRFALAAGAPEAMDWPTAETPWIALDRDDDGAITTGAELFGDHTPGGRYANGFEALAALDDNHDGVIDAADPAFAHLVLWADVDRDGRSSPDELTPLSARIVSISLADTLDVRCDARRNCEGERAPLVWRDAAGARQIGSVVDVYLPGR